jgi:hypothetical protein
VIRFQCTCGKVLKAPDHGIGRKVTCPRCGQRLLVPAPVPVSSCTVLGKALRDSQPARGAAPPSGVNTAAAPPDGQLLVACPGCGRSTPVLSHELSVVTIECVVCKANFIAAPPAAPPVILPARAALPRPLSLGRALGFPFREQGCWVKLLILAAVQYVPIFGGMASLGWRMELARRVRAGEEESLPSWGDLGGKLWTGFLLNVVWYLMQLPAVIGGVIVMFLFLLQFAYLFVDDDRQFETRLGIEAVSLAVKLTISALLAAFSLVAHVLYLVAKVRYVANPRFGVFFQVGRNAGLLMRHPGDFLVLFFCHAAVNVIALLIGAVLAATHIGAVLAPGLTWAPPYWVDGHLYGQLSAKIVPDERDGY